LIKNRDYFLNNALYTAKNILGDILVLKKDNFVFEFKIVETEAYCGIKDKACHSYEGKKTKRNLSMYKSGGHIYVYMIYGMYYCMNIVCSKENDPQAVLIRGVEPLNHLDFLKRIRNVKKTKDISNGPGKLCMAYKIDKNFDGYDLLDSKDLYLRRGNKAFEVVESKRINIDYSEEFKDKLWRFYIKDNEFVSKK
jgi:DNA-3-methyladenine glycosylase